MIAVYRVLLIFNNDQGQGLVMILVVRTTSCLSDIRKKSLCSSKSICNTCNTSFLQKWQIAFCFEIFIAHSKQRPPWQHGIKTAFVFLTQQITQTWSSIFPLVSVRISALLITSLRADRAPASFCLPSASFSRSVAAGCGSLGARQWLARISSVHILSPTFLFGMEARPFLSSANGVETSHLVVVVPSKGLVIALKSVFVIRT